MERVLEEQSKSFVSGAEIQGFRGGGGLQRSPNGWNEWTVTCSIWNYVTLYIFQNLNGNAMTDSNSLNNSKESIIEVPSNRIYSSLNNSEVGMLMSMGLHERYK